NEEVVPCAQFLQPRGPETAIAHKTMDEHHAAPRRLPGSWGKTIRHLAPAKGLAPEEHAWGGRGLAQPGMREFPPGGLWSGVAAAHETHNHEFECEHRGVSQRDRDRARGSAQRRIAP